MIERCQMEKEVKEIRKLFPIYSNNPNMIYLDSGATSLKPKCVLDKMEEYYQEYGVNIHRGVYSLSYKATDEYDKARQNVARFINAKESEIIFTKNVSESLNMLCLMYSKKLNEGDEIISSYLEHHSSILPWIVSANEHNFKIKYASLDKDGRFNVDAFKKEITEKSKVLVLAYVSNVMGYMADAKEMIKVAHEHNMIVILDAAQAIQHTHIDVKELDCDFLAFSGHKMFGPTGIGVLYGKKKLLKTLSPLYYGGDMNEEVYTDNVDIKEVPYCFETGTPPIAEAIGLSEAINFIDSIGFEKIKEHDKSLLEYLNLKLKDIKGIDVYNKNPEAPIISFNVKGVHPHDAASFFDEKGICLRAGHHCAQLLTKWLGVNGTLRASCHIYNDYDDIDKFVECVKEVVNFFSQLGA